MQLKILRTLFVGIIIFQNLNCQTDTYIDDKKEIYSIIIDNIARPFPPLQPPPPGTPDKKFESISQTVSDSLAKIKLNVAIAPYFEIARRDIYKQNMDASYLKIADQLFAKDTIHAISGEMIGSKKGHKVTIVNRNELKDKDLLFRNFSQLISLSKVIINSDMNRAVVYVGRTLPGKLSGSTYLYLMEKESGAWKIKKVKELSIS